MEFVGPQDSCLAALVTRPGGRLSQPRWGYLRLCTLILLLGTQRCWSCGMGSKKATSRGWWRWWLVA